MKKIIVLFYSDLQQKVYNNNEVELSGTILQKVV